MCLENPEEVAFTGTVDNQSAYYSALNAGKPIGLARDGHIIVGPHTWYGSRWTCDMRDACNGAFVDDKYVYVATG